MDALLNAQFGFAPALALALLHSLWQGALLAAMAWLALQLLARHGAALRHSVGMAFLLAMVAVPAVTLSRFWSQPSTEVNAGLLPAMTAPAIGATPGVFVQQSSGLAAALSLLWLLGVVVMLLRQLGGLAADRCAGAPPVPPVAAGMAATGGRTAACPADFAHGSRAPCRRCRGAIHRACPAAGDLVAAVVADPAAAGAVRSLARP